jgi:hypothetical protein
MSDEPDHRALHHYAGLNFARVSYAQQPVPAPQLDELLVLIRRDAGLRPASTASRFIQFRRHDSLIPRSRAI